MYVARSIASRTVGSLLVRSTRRSATVTISAPEAASAARVSSFDLYLPVPTMMRECRVLPASCQESVTDLASSDERHDLEAVAVGQGGGGVVGLGDDVPVALDGDRAAGQAELRDQREDGDPGGDGAWLAIHHHLDQ